MLYSPRIMDTQMDTWAGRSILCWVGTRLTSSSANPGRFRIPVAGSRGGPQPQPFQRAANRLRRVRASVSWSATPSPWPR